VLAEFKKDRGKGVSSIVEADMWEPGLLEQHVEVTYEIPWIERPSVFKAKHKAVILIGLAQQEFFLALLSLMAFQLGQHIRRDGPDFAER